MGGIETTTHTHSPRRRPSWSRPVAAAVLALGLLAACGTADDAEVLGVVQERPEPPAVTGTYDATGQEVEVTIRLLGADGTEIDGVHGEGGFDFTFEALEAGTYEVEVVERGEPVEAGGETTSSTFVGRTDPFDLGEDDTVEITCRWRDGCHL